MKKILLSFLCLIAAIGVNAQAEVDIPIDEGWGSAWNAEAQYADGILTIGIKKAEKKASSWVVLDNFKLTYLGKNSSQTVSPDLTAIETVEGKAMKVEFFTLDGRKATSAHKGIMIQKVTLSNGTTLIQKIRN